MRLTPFWKRFRPIWFLTSGKQSCLYIATKWSTVPRKQMWHFQGYATTPFQILQFWASKSTRRNEHKRKPVYLCNRHWSEIKAAMTCARVIDSAWVATQPPALKFLPVARSKLPGDSSTKWSLITTHLQVKFVPVGNCVSADYLSLCSLTVIQYVNCLPVG